MAISKSVKVGGSYYKGYELLVSASAGAYILDMALDVNCVINSVSMTPDVYGAILARHGVSADRFLMIGNSLRSDILPVLEIGGQAVHVPYAITWAHEHVDVPPDQQGRYHELEHIGQLPTLIKRLTR